MQRAAAFVDEVRSSLEFYTAQAKEVQIGRVKVTGGGSRLEGLFELMRRGSVPVEPGAVFGNVAHQLDEAASRPRSRSWPSRSGWACRRWTRESRQPASQRDQEVRSPAPVRAVRAGGIALILLVIAFWFFQSTSATSSPTSTPRNRRTRRSNRRSTACRNTSSSRPRRSRSSSCSTPHTRTRCRSPGCCSTSRSYPVRHLPHELRIDPGATDRRGRSTSSSSTSTTTTTSSARCRSRGNPALRIAQHLAEPTESVQGWANPGLERHRRLGDRRGLPVRRIRGPHPGRSDSARRGRSGGSGG